MLKNIKLFTNHSAYNSVKNNLDKPNVVLCAQEDEVHFNPTPQPIAPVGKVQVFANPQCTAYADGQSNEVWVRLNQDFGFNDSHSWGNINEAATYLAVVTPITEIPDDDYFISCWVDFHSIEHDYTQPFTSGQIIKCYFDPSYFTPIDNPQVIFE